MPVGIDNIARGLASKALKGLDNKANLVDGKIPAEELPSYVDEVVEGYYYNNKFYEDVDHTKEMVGDKSKIYVDKSTEPYISYRWSGTAYFPISSGGIVGDVTADKVIYNKKTVVASTVGGLKQGLSLENRTLENIIERLVGAYVAPSFTSSFIVATYSKINKRTGIDGNYCLGDTVQLKSVYLSLKKGTDYDGIVGGSIMEDNSIVYSLTQKDIESLSNNGQLEINLTGIEHTFPENVTSDSVKFAAQVNYNKKSYDVNENIVVNKVGFVINSETISVKDEETYSKLYVGALPTEAVLSGLQPDGTASFVGGSVKLNKYDSLGNIFVTTTEENTQAVFVCEDLLTDIKFLGFSDIDDWARSEQAMSYTRANGTTYSKVFHVYTQVIAVDTFTYELE